MALPEDFNKIYGSTATGGLTPISDVDYAKGWEFVGSNPPTKNDFSYLQNLSDLKAKWLYDNSMNKSANGSDISDKGAFQNNLGLTFSGTINSFVSKGPGLMIQQGGKITAPSGTGNFLVVNFPISFPNGCVAAFAIFEDGVYNQTPFEVAIVPTNSNMTVGILSSGGTIFYNGRSIRWYAVGF